MKIIILQNSQENTCARVFLFIKLQAKACNFIKKETLPQIYSCEFCGISKNTSGHLTKHLRWLLFGLKRFTFHSNFFVYFLDYMK